MRLLNDLTISRTRGAEPPAVIQLLQGDLSALPPEHKVDALVVSAFPQSYTPNPGTLFGSLYKRGLVMAHIAARKEEDQRAHLGCWISKPLSAEDGRKFNFSRVICFEPRFPRFMRNSGIKEQNIEDTVGFVFRCLNNFVLPNADGRRRFEIKRVAMPLLATGNQAVGVEVLFQRLLEAAIFWLMEGLPIEQLKLVAFRPEHVRMASRTFQKVKTEVARSGMDSRRREPADITVGGWEKNLARSIADQVIRATVSHLRTELMAAATARERALVTRLFERIECDRDSVPVAQGSGPPDASDYDFFVSYAHKQDAEVQAFVSRLKRSNPSLRIFYDRDAIAAGEQWIKRISDAVSKAHVFVAVLSPDYTASPVCWDEFQCAKLKEYNTRQSVIRTIRLYSEKHLPPIMGIYSYIDCAEGDLKKLCASATTLVRGTRNQTPDGRRRIALGYVSVKRKTDSAKRPGN